MYSVRLASLMRRGFGNCHNCHGEAESAEKQTAMKNLWRRIGNPCPHPLRARARIKRKHMHQSASFGLHLLPLTTAALGWSSHTRMWSHATSVSASKITKACGTFVSVPCESGTGIQTMLGCHWLLLQVLGLGPRNCGKVALGVREWRHTRCGMWRGW